MKTGLQRGLQTNVMARITEAHARGTSFHFWQPNEIVRCLLRELMDPTQREEYLEDVHLRILRVTEDLRAIQRELNCAAMEAPNDPELMEALSELPELEALEVLKSALDQMRHFLWFYVQVMTNDSDVGEKLRETLAQRAKQDAVQRGREKYDIAAEAMMLRYLADHKNRKPN